MVPEMTPDEDMVNPLGKPVAVKVMGSLSGSENAEARENDTWFPTLSDLLFSEEATGGRLDEGAPLGFCDIPTLKSHFKLTGPPGPLAESIGMLIWGKSGPTFTCKPVTGFTGEPGPSPCSKCDEFCSDNM